MSSSSFSLLNAGIGTEPIIRAGSRTGTFRILRAETGTETGTETFIFNFNK